MSFKVFSTFTGIGGFELGIDEAWLQTEPEAEYPIVVGYSEIDKYAISVYEHHFKGVKNYGDITKIDAETLPDFDCLVGGFPCQSFSVAGKRGGFNDTRGTLFFDLARILRAKQPRLFVFENVKGLTNHDDGRTFKTIIATIDELGYDCQWQLLNSKDFGVPQNRERIIIVGHLRGTARPQVFPIIGADSQASTADAVRVGTLRTHKDGNGFREMKSGLAPTLPARARNDGSGQPVILTSSPHYVDGKRVMKTSVSDQAPTIRATQYKSGDNQPKVLVPEATQKGYAEAEVGDSINLVHPNSKTRRGRVGKGIANTIDTGMHQYTVQPVITPDRLNKSQNGRRFKDDGDPAFTVTAQDRHGVLLSKTVRAGGRGSPHGSKQNWDSYEVGGVIRRLTPLECERLQGFPDNWTMYGVVGKNDIMLKMPIKAAIPGTMEYSGLVSDTQRYKMCGNAVTTNVIQAVFERIFAS